jgi:hypothetical protein
MSTDKEQLEVEDDLVESDDDGTEVLSQRWPRPI